MDSLYTPEQIMFRDAVAKFARAELAEGRVARANADGLDPATTQKLVDMGLMGIMMDEADGGQGGGRGGDDPARPLQHRCPVRPGQIQLPLSGDCAGQACPTP